MQLLIFRNKKKKVTPFISLFLKKQIPYNDYLKLTILFANQLRTLFKRDVIKKDKLLNFIHQIFLLLVDDF